MKQAVGASDGHTPVKHYLLNADLGKCAGAAAYLPDVDRFTIADLCAGDGVSSPFSGRSSPSIILKHAANALRMAEQRGHDLDVRVFLIERNPLTCTQLQENIRPMPPWCKIINDDYSSPEVISQISSRNPRECIFLHIDPNHVNDLRFPDSLRQNLPPRTTFLSTFGCNVGGLKRLLEDHRRSEWFPILRNHCSILLSSHDIVFAKLGKDASLWAYLLNAPKIWKKDFNGFLVKAGKEQWTKGIEFYWKRESPAAFNDLVERLFLTKNERAQ